MSKPYLDLKFRCFKNDGVIVDEDGGGEVICIARSTLALPQQFAAIGIASRAVTLVHPFVRCGTSCQPGVEAACDSFKALLRRNLLILLLGSNKLPLLHFIDSVTFSAPSHKLLCVSQNRYFFLECDVRLGVYDALSRPHFLFWIGPVSYTGNSLYTSAEYVRRWWCRRWNPLDHTGWQGLGDDSEQTHCTHRHFRLLSRR